MAALTAVKRNRRPPSIRARRMFFGLTPRMYVWTLGSFQQSTPVR